MPGKHSFFSQPGKFEAQAHSPKSRDFFFSTALWPEEAVPSFAALGIAALGIVFRNLWKSNFGRVLVIEVLPSSLGEELASSAFMASCGGYGLKLLTAAKATVLVKAWLVINSNVSTAGPQSCKQNCQHCAPHIFSRGAVGPRDFSQGKFGPKDDLLLTLRAEDRRSVHGPSLLTVAFPRRLFLTTVTLTVEWEGPCAVGRKGKFGPKDQLFPTLRAKDGRSVQGPSLPTVAFLRRCLSNGRLSLVCDARESFKS